MQAECDIEIATEYSTGHKKFLFEILLRLRYDLIMII